MTRLRALALMALVAVASPVLVAQSIEVRNASGALQVKTGLGFLSGPALARLKDGQSVRFEFELAVLEQPDGPVVARAQHVFNVSFDLWEERFAVSRVGTPPRSVSHLAARSAETWCLDQVTLPVAAMGRFARDEPFWIRLAYQVQDSQTAEPNGDPTFIVGRLIDILSRRSDGTDGGRSVTGGPFRLPK